MLLLQAVVLFLAPKNKKSQLCLQNKNQFAWFPFPAIVQDFIFIFRSKKEEDPPPTPYCPSSLLWSLSSLTNNGWDAFKVLTGPSALHPHPPAPRCTDSADQRVIDVFSINDKTKVPLCARPSDCIITHNGGRGNYMWLHMIEGHSQCS